MPPPNFPDPFEFDRRDDHRGPERPPVLLLLLAGGAGIALLILVAAGVTLFLALNSARSANGIDPTFGGGVTP